MKKLLAVLLCAFIILAGCAALQPVASRAAGVIKDYCLQSYDQRLVIRSQVNQSIAPNTIKITCVGDPA